jgi:hypothetical protein
VEHLELRLLGDVPACERLGERFILLVGDGDAAYVDTAVSEYAVGVIEGRIRLSRGLDQPRLRVDVVVGRVSEANSRVAAARGSRACFDVEVLDEALGTRRLAKGYRRDQCGGNAETACARERCSWRGYFRCS